MHSDQQAFERLRDQARQARSLGHYGQAARLERQAAEWAKSLGLAASQARALLWEGYSLRLAGEDDLALAALLQVASEQLAAADPADVFGALTAIVHISLERKPACFCRALLEQARRYLADHARPWTAPLDFLAGELAYRQGDFTTAQDWHDRAWAAWRDEYPRLTPATHRWALCRMAFRRHDLVALEDQVARLSDCQPVVRLERQLVQRAQLLRWRAWQASGDAQASPAPVTEALALLSGRDATESRDNGARSEAMRALALVGRWDAVDAIGSQQEQPATDFETALLLGDLALARARATAGLPAEDDDYGAGSDEADSLAVAAPEAARYYRAALALAMAEDERLETSWHGHLVRQRLARLAPTSNHDAPGP